MELDDVLLPLQVIPKERFVTISNLNFQGLTREQIIEVVEKIYCESQEILNELEVLNPEETTDFIRGQINERQEILNVFYQEFNDAHFGIRINDRVRSSVLEERKRWTVIQFGLLLLQDNYGEFYQIPSAILKNNKEEIIEIPVEHIPL